LHDTFWLTLFINYCFEISDDGYFVIGLLVSPEVGVVESMGIDLL